MRSRLGIVPSSSPISLRIHFDDPCHLKFNRTQIYADNRRYKKDAMRIALSAKRLSVYIRVQKGISYTINLLTDEES
jgi:hypothetical protein